MTASDFCAVACAMSVSGSSKAGLPSTLKSMLPPSTDAWPQFHPLYDSAPSSTSRPNVAVQYDLTVSLSCPRKPLNLVDEAALGAHLELVRVRDLDPLRRAQVGLLDRHDVARHLGLPADAAGVQRRAA